MRIKALLSLAALAACAVTASAQVYSANIVGYANVNVNSGFNLIANPFNTGSNGGDVVLPATDSSQVLLWNGTGFATYTYDSGFGGWIDPDFNTAVPTVAPGTGFFYFAPADTTLTFVGEVACAPGSTVTTTIAQGFWALGSKIPFAGAINAAPINLADQESAQFLSWNGTGYNTVTYDSGFGGWIDPDFNTVPAPSITVGQGFFYFNPSPSYDWVEGL